MSTKPPVNCEGEGPPENPPKLHFAFDIKDQPYIGDDNKYVPPPTPVGELDYSTSDCGDHEADYVAGLMAEALNAAAGPVNVFPLLGVHNQGSTLDLVDANGYPLSSGTPSGYTIANAFDINDDAWRSVQSGVAVLSAPAFIGYDFGTKKAWQAIGATGLAAERYMPSEPVRKRVSTLKIKQSADPLRRASQLRVEASDDGITWKRVDVVKVPNNDQMNSVMVRSVAAYNKWRFIPVFFAGVAADLEWEVVQLQLLEQTQLSLDNIEDPLLLENRARAYCRHSTMIKCTYDLLDVQTELAKFGINLPQTYIFSCSFAVLVKALGRPIVIGDVLELPGEAQYDANLRPVRKWLEVTDTAWDTNGYTNNWRPNLYKFYAQPILPSVEHADLLGLPGEVNDAQSDVSLDLDGPLHNFLGREATENLVQTMEDRVPQDGADGQDIQSGRSMLGREGTYDGREMFSQDAIPPDGAPYTKGDALPAANTISDGHYHRQTYESVNQMIRPPDRLLRWYADIQRWKAIEINTRAKPESHMKTVAKILNAPPRDASGEGRINLDDLP